MFLGEKVTKYHRTLTTYLNTLLSNGFIINHIVEPQPPEYMMDIPGMQPANKKSRVNYGILKVLYRSKTRYQNKTARNVGLKKDIK